MSNSTFFQGDSNTPDNKTAGGRAFLRVALLITLGVILGTFGVAFTGEKTTFLFKDTLHMTPGDIGTLAIIVGIPTYLQPFFGAGSDLFPIFGLHRRPYYAIAVIVCSGALYGLATLHQYHYAVILCILLILAAGRTLIGVMVNAVMVAVGNETRRLGQLQSLIFFIPAVLGLIYTAKLGGYVTQYWSYYQAYSAGALLMLLHLPLTFLIDEKPAVTVSGDGSVSRNSTRRTERAHSMLALRNAARSPGLWAIVGFVFYLIITPGSNNAQLFYQTDVLHLSKNFIGGLGKYSSAGSIVAMGLFAAFSRKMPVLYIVLGAWLMDCLSYPAMLIVHNAPSSELSAFVTACVGVWYSLCLYTLAARACPPGVEGTVYGLVMSAIALAGVFSEKLGGNLYDYFGPLNSAHHWTIHHGWKFSLLIGLVFTLVAFVFIPFLPDWAKSRKPLSEPKTDFSLSS